MNRNRRGFSLVELLVYTFLLGLLLDVAGTALSRTYSVTVAYTNRAVDFRNASVAVQKMCQQLAVCDLVYAPAITDPSFAEGATWPLTRPFVFRYYSNAAVGDVVIGYNLTPQGYLERLQYAPNFDPAQPSTQVVQAATQSGGSVQNASITRLPRAANHNTDVLQMNLTLLEAQTKTVYPLMFVVRVKTLGPGY